MKEKLPAALLLAPCQGLSPVPVPMGKHNPGQRFGMGGNPIFPFSQSPFCKALPPLAQNATDKPIFMSKTLNKLSAKGIFFRFFRGLAAHFPLRSKQQ
jgi:hypothetical protein